MNCEQQRQWPNDRKCQCFLQVFVSLYFRLFVVTFLFECHDHHMSYSYNVQVLNQSSPFQNWCESFWMSKTESGKKVFACNISLYVYRDKPNESKWEKKREKIPHDKQIMCWSLMLKGKYYARKTYKKDIHKATLQESNSMIYNIHTVCINRQTSSNNVDEPQRVFSVSFSNFSS